MIINHIDRWAYIGINKNGSTSLHDYLKQPPFWGFDPEPANQHRRELPAGAYDYRLLVIVRNPFARALSLWRHALYQDMPGIGFEDFLHQCPSNPDPFYSHRQVDFLTGHETLVRIEYLTLGLAAFFHDWYLPAVPRVNATESRDFREAYTPTAIDFVRDYYRQDFGYLAYSPYLLEGVSIPHTCQQCHSDCLLIDGNRIWCPTCTAPDNTQ